MKLDMQRLQSNMDSSLIATITNHFKQVINQVKLISKIRLASYAKHAKVTQLINDMTTCHYYKVANII
jgi:hypothetical protein